VPWGIHFDRDAIDLTGTPGTIHIYVNGASATTITVPE
jgi:hypothetical protein